MMHGKKKTKLTFRADELAIPEIHTGKVEETEELESDSAEIQYDTVAIPEIHLRKKEAGE